jgi:hypothetical protein
MGRPGGYLGYMFSHENRVATQDGWEVKGTVHWTLAPDRVYAQGWEKVLDEWSREGYKIGLLLRTDQTILNLIYGDVPLASVNDPDAFTLERTYGTPAGYKWVVWGGSGRRQCRVIEPITVTFSVLMRITPADPAPLVIPVASRHLKGSFIHSMPGLWAIGSPKQADNTADDLRSWMQQGQALLDQVLRRPH